MIPVVLLIIVGVILLMASGLSLDRISEGKLNVLGSGSANIAGSNTKTPLGKYDFFLTIIQYGKSYDWNILVPLTMAALETNYAKSCYFYNLFNITTSSNDPVQFFKYPSIPTLKFKKYVGYNESVVHFWNLLKLSRYKTAFHMRHDPRLCIIALINAGYAGSLTDPARYLSRLNEVTAHYNQYFGG